MLEIKKAFWERRYNYGKSIGYCLGRLEADIMIVRNAIDMREKDLSKSKKNTEERKRRDVYECIRSIIVSHYGEAGCKELYRYAEMYPAMNDRKLSELIYRESEYWFGSDGSEKE
ncbi:MAG: hypothetical protein J6M27_03045 [Lachnospiraceae bacterium]|nr:hypothetical protein [Lachnospiraceae bacterium]